LNGGGIIRLPVAESAEAPHVGGDDERLKAEDEQGGEQWSHAGDGAKQGMLLQAPRQAQFFSSAVARRAALC